MTQPIRLKIRGKSYLYCHNIKRINLFVISFVWWSDFTDIVKQYVRTPKSINYMYERAHHPFDDCTLSFLFSILTFFTLCS